MSTELAAGVQPYSNIVSSPPVDTTLTVPYDQLKNRVVVITGGASGIGASIARAVAQAGGNVIIGDVSTSAGEELVASLRGTSKSDHHHFLKLDVTSWQSQFDFFRRAAELSSHGGIDTVIANAGIAPAGENLLFESPPNYSKGRCPSPPPHKLLNVNVIGVLYTTELAFSYLSRNPASSKCSYPAKDGPRDRHLLLVSSIAGLCPLPTQSLYCMSKHAVVGLFRSLRITAPIVSGVRVNMLNPYFTQTPILGAGGPIIFTGARMANVEDVTGAALRLIADKNIVGRALMIVSRGAKQQVEAAGLEWRDGDQHGNAVVDVHAHDFVQTDVFTRRMIAITNLVSAVRGWAGFMFDLLAHIFMFINKAIGR